MSVKGSPQRWYEQAVARGDLAGALVEVGSLPQPLALPYALGLVVLYGEAGDPRFPRAAARWAGRFAVEHPTVDLATMRTLVLALSALQDTSPAARLALGAVAESQGLDRARELLIPSRAGRP